MRRLLFLALVWCPTAFSLSADLFLHEFERPYGALSQDACEQARKYQFLFVKGFLNELYPVYFEDHARWLEECGVTRIHWVRVPSTRDFSENAARITELIIGGGFRWIIVAHSKGAMEALVSAIQNPKVFDERVAGALLIQGSFRGSYIADYLLGTGKPVIPIIGSLIQKAVRKVWGTIRKVEKLVGEPIDNGLASVGTRRTASYWKSPATAETVQLTHAISKVLNIRSLQSRVSVHPLLFAPAQYIRLVYGEKNDGLLTLDAQIAPYPSMESIDLDADHLDTIFPSWLSGYAPEKRIRAFCAFLQTTR